MIRHVLLDADGVLQELPGGWLAAVEPYVGVRAAEFRDHGLGVHLATNQTAGRAAYMRLQLGYDELFDESFYSCEVGLAAEHWHLRDGPVRLRGLLAGHGIHL